MHHHAPNVAIVFSFGMRGVTADVITRAKFFVSQFRGLGVLTPEDVLSP